MTSQFEQQLRAVCGLPLGGTGLLKPAAMANLLGDFWREGEPNWAAALANFESVIKCKPSLASKAYLSACHSKNFAKATTYFRMSGSKDTMAQICMKEGFDPRKP